MRKFIIHIILIIFILVLFIACKDEKVAEFRITNNTESVIDSIKISCSNENYKNKSSIYILPLEESLSLNLDMYNIEKIDGNYLIEVFEANKKRIKDFGYYSNGNPINSIYLINIKKDTILIRESMK